MHQIVEEEGISKSDAIKKSVDAYLDGDDGGDDWPAMVTEQIVGTSAVAAITIGLATLLGWAPQLGGAIVAVVLLSMAIVGSYALQGDLL
jgi:hypothetical protein